MIVKTAHSFPVSIFMAGDINHAQRVCSEHCDEVGLCVTLTPTTYVYTGGQEAGFVVGLINYPRFPQGPEELHSRALELGMRLRLALGQDSFSIQTNPQTTWFSWREEDNQ
jgi:hypothetical protein